MKLRNLFFASLAMVTFAACSNDDEPAMPDNNTPVDAKALDLTFTTKNLTKADPNDDINAKGGNETKIKSLKVYIFQGSTNTYFGERDVTVGTGTADTYNVTIDGLKTKTAYTLVAIANPHGTLTTTSLSELQKSPVEYDTQFAEGDGFTMSGSVTITEQELAAATETKENLPKTIFISRRLGAIELTSVAINLPDDAPENFKSATATLKSAYMVNVRKAAQMGSDATSDVVIENTSAAILYGKDGAFATAHPTPAAELNTRLSMPSMNKVLTTGGTTFGNATRIYAFPTDGTRMIQDKKTDVEPALKLEVFFKNEALSFEETRYYTIFINGDNEGNKIKNNVLYQITADIKGLGSKDDNTPEETAQNVAATITVSPWVVKAQDAGNLTD